MTEERKTWREVVEDLREALGRKPTREELIEASKGYDMTVEEIEEQRQSWALQNMD